MGMADQASPKSDHVQASERALALAKKYVWWRGPETTLAEPADLFAQIMTLGTVEDADWMLTRVSRDDLRALLRTPPIGLFNGRSWTYWHRWLDQTPIPPLPTRTLPP